MGVNHLLGTMMRLFELFLMLAVFNDVSFGFSVGRIASRRTCGALTPSLIREQFPMWAAASADETGEVGSGPNWIERSFPVDVEGDEEMNAKKVEDYDLGISGVSFQTGPLSKRMFDAIMSTNKNKMEMSDEVRTAFTLYAMDFTAKEATKAALKQNGLEMVLETDMEDEGLWGDVDSIQLLDPDTETPVGPLYDTTDDAIKDWTPGQGFNFVVRQVPAKLRELSLDELLQALDPDGKLREEAKAKGMTLPDEDLTSLSALANDSLRRSQYIPGDNDEQDDDEPFAGIENKRGYSVISMSDLLNDNINSDGTENQKTLMHVMDALVSHGALVVDITDGGANSSRALVMAEMWNETEKLFAATGSDPEYLNTMSAVSTAVGNTGSSQAKVGFISYDDGATQVIETRFERKSETKIGPEGIQDILGPDGVSKLRASFDLLTDIGKSVVRITNAASSMEANAFAMSSGEDDGDSPSISGLAFLSGEEDEDGSKEAAKASEKASRMVQEILDDATPFGLSDSEEQSISSMTSQSFRQYKSSENNTEAERMGLFSPQVDSSFVALYPVAADSEEEVFDEDVDRWYRPALMARRHWESQHEDSLEDGVLLPWHTRYVIVMPGELLQLTTRDEVPAAVHRIAKLNDGGLPRLAAPVFLHGRPESKMDVEKYFGRPDKAGPLLSDCLGMTMGEISDAMQPSSFQ